MDIKQTKFKDYNRYLIQKPPPLGGGSSQVLKLVFILI